MLVNVMEPSVFANWYLVKLDTSPPMETGIRDPVFFNDFISKESHPGTWETCSWIVKLARSWEKIYITKEQRRYLHFQLLASKCYKKREVRDL